MLLTTRFDKSSFKKIYPSLSLFTAPLRLTLVSRTRGCVLVFQLAVYLHSMQIYLNYIGRLESTSETDHSGFRCHECGVSCVCVCVCVCVCGRFLFVSLGSFYIVVGGGYTTRAYPTVISSGTTFPLNAIFVY